ncbi:hypothetical protein JDV02_009646 [Purpureocillium takamizusanense]|uniref:Uncharacterized protein n=1 Tax=Purpureocillium takamizusanense TaxID=2060973 RepID=A0A9Q8VFQ4_9HYPO|nr:uncharacterized protein JDV02_009646 [Purpureocillium takamizusanense]UNI23853.1 hypothetical protein JDV02_009646 [Purpureocillium takamizusanense]
MWLLPAPAVGGKVDTGGIPLPVGEAAPDVCTPEGMPVPPDMTVSGGAVHEVEGTVERVTMSGVDDTGGHAPHWTVVVVAWTIVRAVERELLFPLQANDNYTYR